MMIKKEGNKMEWELRGVSPQCFGIATNDAPVYLLAITVMVLGVLEITYIAHSLL